MVEHEKDLPPHFISAMQINSLEHVNVLAAAQKHVDNSISKTCNGAADDTVESVDELYHLARKLGCKAVSYYRDGSREGQVLNTMKASEPAADSPSVDAEAVSTANSPAASRMPDSSAVHIERPRELQGSTWRIPFDNQNLYVTVNHNGERCGGFCDRPISEGAACGVQDASRGF